MKAIVYSKFGGPDVLNLREIDTPELKEGRVLVKIQAAALNPLDWHFVRGLPYVIRLTAGVRKPKKSRLGVDLAGTVAAVGPGVTKFAPGDEVYGQGYGSCAEYATAVEHQIAVKPVTLSFSDAAAVPVAAATALLGLRDKGQLVGGQSVLVNGAAGGVGTFAVQIAKSMGARVTGVCSTTNVDMVRSLGADDVVDYTQNDFTRSGSKYDFILDCVGNHSIAEFRRALVPKGTLRLVGGGGGALLGPAGLIVRAMVVSPLYSQRISPVSTAVTTELLDQLSELFNAGKLRSVLDRTYPLSESADALAYLESGHARGKVVIKV